MIVRHGFHTAALTIGFVIGGKPKNAQQTDKQAKGPDK